MGDKDDSFKTLPSCSNFEDYVTDHVIQSFEILQCQTTLAQTRAQTKQLFFQNR